MMDASETTEVAEIAGGAAERYLVFSILGKLYTFPTRFVGEVAMFEAVYPLPLVPPFVLGIINRYSIPHALLDVGVLLFGTPSPRSKVLVLKESVDRIALLVDDVAGIADVPARDLLAVDRNHVDGGAAEAVSASFAWGGGDVLVLDVHRILSRIESGAA